MQHENNAFYVRWCYMQRYAPGVNSALVCITQDRKHDIPIAKGTQMEECVCFVWKYMIPLIFLLMCGEFITVTYQISPNTVFTIHVSRTLFTQTDVLSICPITSYTKLQQSAIILRPSLAAELEHKAGTVCVGPSESMVGWKRQVWTIMLCSERDEWMINALVWRCAQTNKWIFSDDFHTDPHLTSRDGLLCFISSTLILIRL